MRSIPKVVISIYEKISKQHAIVSEKVEATKQYILNEITQWSIKSSNKSDGYLYKPIEFSGDEKSFPFEVRLRKAGPYDGMYELDFGNLNAKTDKKMYSWSDNDPYRLQKALFLKTVLELKIVPLLETEEVKAIIFSPYNGDGLGEDRYSYFYNMYSKLEKNKFDLQLMDEDTYIITKK